MTLFTFKTNDRELQCRFVVQSPNDLTLPNRQLRSRTPRDVEKIVHTIGHFGSVTPLVVEPNGLVIDGVARLQAARRLKLSELPTIVVEGWSRADVCALSLVLNRAPEDATWDRAALADAFATLIEIDSDFELDLTGFEVAEVDKILIEKDAQGLRDEIDQNIPLPPERPVAQVGDIYHLGCHSVACGSSIEPRFNEFLARDVAQVAVFDPPYNREPRSIGGLGRIKHGPFPMASGEMAPEEFANFLESAVRAHADALVEGGLLYSFSDWKMAYDLQTAAQAVGLTQINLCIWDKKSGGMGGLYRNQHELCFVFRRGDAPHQNNILLGKYGRNRTNVWSLAGAATLDRERRADLALHPTVKPVSLLEDILLDCTKRGDVVLDGFLGSGSMLLAAHRTGRVCRGVELSPKYVDVSIQRWEAMTGLEAVHEASGLTFRELRARRHRARPQRTAA